MNDAQQKYKTSALCFSSNFNLCWWIAIKPDNVARLRYWLEQWLTWLQSTLASVASLGGQCDTRN